MPSLLPSRRTEPAYVRMGDGKRIFDMIVAFIHQRGGYRYHRSERDREEIEADVVPYFK